MIAVPAVEAAGSRSRSSCMQSAYYGTASWAAQRHSMNSSILRPGPFKLQRLAAMAFHAVCCCYLVAAIFIYGLLCTYACTRWRLPELQAAYPLLQQTACEDAFASAPNRTINTYESKLTCRSSECVHAWDELACRCVRPAA
jgi:hypothetical protein